MVLDRERENMTDLMTKRLGRLRNRPTAYEIVATCEATGERYLLTYAIRWTWRVMRSVVSERRDELERATGVRPNDWQRGDKVTDPITGKDSQDRVWQIRKSGRTQRESYLSGEVPWVVKE